MHYTYSIAALLFVSCGAGSSALEPTIAKELEAVQPQKYPALPRIEYLGKANPAGDGTVPYIMLPDDSTPLIGTTFKLYYFTGYPKPKVPRDAWIFIGDTPSDPKDIIIFRKEQVNSVGDFRRTGGNLIVYEKELPKDLSLAGTTYYTMIMVPPTEDDPTFAFSKICKVTIGAWGEYSHGGN